MRLMLVAASASVGLFESDFELGCLSLEFHLDVNGCSGVSDPCLPNSPPRCEFFDDVVVQPPAVCGDLVGGEIPMRQRPVKKVAECSPGFLVFVFFHLMPVDRAARIGGVTFAWSVLVEVPVVLT